MSGYGRGVCEGSGLRVTVELRTVNHRFLDISTKLPRGWMPLESRLTAKLRGSLRRGRVEFFARRELLEGGASRVVVDMDLARSIHEEGAQLAESLGIEGSVTAAQLLRMPGVLSVRESEVDIESEVGLVEGALAEAVTALLAMREGEGQRMAADVAGYLERIQELSAAARGIADRMPDKAKARIERRLESLLGAEAGSLDPVRLAQEVALLADKAAVDEELARLASHIAQARELLQSSEAVGRRLEFLVQELNREANTLASKSSDSELSALAVELKSVIEKVREQVANIE